MSDIRYHGEYQNLTYAFVPMIAVDSCSRGE